MFKFKTITRINKIIIINNNFFLLNKILLEFIHTNLL